MSKVAHIYNTKGQSVCSEEFYNNEYNEVPYGYKEINELINGPIPICKKCAYLIGKPYFSDEYLFSIDADDPDYIFDDNHNGSMD